MKIVTWNVNSLNSREQFVAMYLDSEAPDVICIQELKLDDERVPREMFESRGYHLAIHGQPQWNGVLIASKQPITDVHRGIDADDGQARVIAASTFGMRIVNLYCPQGHRADSPKFLYKLRFYDGLIEWLPAANDLSAPLMVVGDLNIAPEARDIFDPVAFANVPSFHPEEHARWGRLVGLGLHDAVVDHVEPGKYSFWDYRAGAFRFNHGMRIDHILVTEPLRGRVERAWIDRQERKKKDGLTPSDHAPVGAILTD